MTSSLAAAAAAAAVAVAAFRSCFNNSLEIAFHVTPECTLFSPSLSTFSAPSCETTDTQTCRRFPSAHPPPSANRSDFVKILIPRRTLCARLCDDWGTTRDRRRATVWATYNMYSHMYKLTTHDLVVLPVYIVKQLIWDCFQRTVHT